MAERRNRRPHALELPELNGLSFPLTIMFGRLKDWRRVATRYDRCPETFFSAIMLAATVLFWL